MGTTGGACHIDSSTRSPAAPSLNPDVTSGAWRSKKGRLYAALPAVRLAQHVLALRPQRGLLRLPQLCARGGRGAVDGQQRRVGTSWRVIERAPHAYCCWPPESLSWGECRDFRKTLDSNGHCSPTCPSSYPVRVAMATERSAPCKPGRVLVLLLFARQLAVQVGRRGRERLQARAPHHSLQTWAGRGRMRNARRRCSWRPWRATRASAAIKAPWTSRGWWPQAPFCFGSR